MDQSITNSDQEARETGYLRVQVRTAGDALPVPGARITVIAADPPTPGQTVAVLFTDESGNTPLLPLPAPPASTTQAPGGGIPSLRYHVITDNTGYYSVQNLFLPIYSGVTAIQNVRLVPYPDLGQTPPFPSDQTRFNESQSPDL